MSKKHLLPAIALILPVGFFFAVQKIQPNPFIDEIFHIPQCQRYCEGDFRYWDTKITTPPGLYLLGYVYQAALCPFSMGSSVAVLRSLNLVGMFVLALIGARLKDRVSIATSPLMVLFYSFFYTDVWSTILVLASLAVGETSSTLSAILGLVSLLFRQTNIVWNGFVMIYILDSLFRKQQHYKGSLIQFARNFFSVKALRVITPFAVNAIIFTGFVVWNDGITLGDKTNHTVSFHLVQIWYCLVFVVFLNCAMLPRNFVASYLRTGFGNTKRVLLSLVLFGGLYLVIRNTTIVHPFLLADNRHHTFYIWRKIINRYSWSRYALIPAYHFATVMTLTKMRKLNAVVTLAYFGSLFCTLVPSPLIEPRYYILPVLFFRCLTSPPDNQRESRLKLEWLFQIAFNLGLFVVFIGFSFPWPNEPDLQRIIW